MGRELSVEDHLKKQYTAGYKVVNGDAQSRALFARLKEECPDVPEEEIIRSFATPGFGTKNVESAIVACVHQKQFNRLNPSPPLGDIFGQLLPEDVAAQVRQDRELATQFAATLSEIEEEFDSKGGGELEAIRKELAEAIQG